MQPFKVAEEHSVTGIQRDHLITPYGGKLVDIRVHQEEIEEVRARASTLPSIQITSRTENDLELLATGGFSPLDRFMGDWYVIAVIPTLIEKEAYNAIENYSQNEDGSITTTFTYNKGAFDGPLKTYQPKGFVKEGTGNAEWGMQFIWPIKAEYLITYLDDNYENTIISRNARDYVWIMSRKPVIDEAVYLKLTAIVANQGYDMSKLRKAPQQ